MNIKTTKCKHCGQTIGLVRTYSKKNMAIEAVFLLSEVIPGEWVQMEDGEYAEVVPHYKKCKRNRNEKVQGMREVNSRI